MITVHHLNRSRSKRLIWALEELNLEYDVVQHQRDPQTSLAPQSLKDIHPLAKAPVMKDGDIVLCESGAILEYFLDQASSETSLRPTIGSPAYYQFQQWMHFAEGSLAFPVIAGLMLGAEDRSSPKMIDLYIQKELALDLSYIESTLTKQTYFAGADFTAADIMMTIILEFSAARDLLKDSPATLAYLNTMQQRPAYQKAKEFG